MRGFGHTVIFPSQKEQLRTEHLQICLNILGIHCDYQFKILYRI